MLTPDLLTMCSEPSLVLVAGGRWHQRWLRCLGGVPPAEAGRGDAGGSVSSGGPGNRCPAAIAGRGSAAKVRGWTALPSVYPCVTNLHDERYDRCYVRVLHHAMHKWMYDAVLGGHRVLSRLI